MESTRSEISTATQWRSELLPRLEGLPLLPTGAGKEGKVPIDPCDGSNLKGWQRKSFTPEQIAATDPAIVTSVGMRGGPDAGGLLIVDIDGQSATDRLAAAGCNIADAGWIIIRNTAPNRCKVVFRVPQEHWPAAGIKGKRKDSIVHGEQLEWFWSTGQVIVAGLHQPSGAQLEWIGGPEEITTIPPTWLTAWQAGWEKSTPAVSDRPVELIPSSSVGSVPLVELLPCDQEAIVQSGCAEGGRDDACFKLAVAAVTAAEGASAKGLAYSGTPEEVVLEFASRCTPPFPEREALKCLRSAESQERTPDAGLAERIAYQRRKASRGSSTSGSWRQEPRDEAALVERATSSTATAEAPKLPPMPVSGGGKRLRLAPDEVLKRLPQMLGTVRLNIRNGDVCTQARGVLNGNQIARLYLELSSTVETWPKDATADAVILLANENQFDPVQEYLEGITAAPLPMEQWQRLDHYLLGIDDPIAAAFLPRYLISAVARTMQPGCYVRQTPVLIGPQERGKTELGRILFGADLWVEGVGALDRDALQRAHMAWGVELAELDGVTRRRDQEQLKAFLTECIDTYQIRYDRCPERHPRRFVFWATANRPPLRDSTGSTRFVCIPIADRMLPIDWARQHRDAIWARALEQYRSGVTWLRTDEQERQEVEARNASFMEPDPWADSVEEFLAKRIAVQTPDLPVKVQQLLMHLEVPRERHNNHNAKRMQEIAERLGWKHGRRRWAGNGPREGLWPPEPAVHPVYPGVHPACTPADPLQSEASGPAVHPVHPISSKGSTKEGEQAGTGGNQESSAHDVISECTGCTPHQIADSDRDSVVHSGVHRGAQRGAHPDRIACSVDGNPGWTRKAGPMRGVSVLVTDPTGKSRLVGREQITDLLPAEPVVPIAP